MRSCVAPQQYEYSRNSTIPNAKLICKEENTHELGLSHRKSESLALPVGNQAESEVGYTDGFEEDSAQNAGVVASGSGCKLQSTTSLSSSADN